jgi:hypothetical protein
MNRILIAAAVAVCTVCAAAGDDEPAGAPDADVRRPEALGRNVRLDFRLVPEEPDDRPTFVVTAVPGYRTRTRFENDMHEIVLAVSGGVELLSKDRILVSVDAEMAFHSEQADAEFHVSSGVLVTPGQDREVASMGERVLVIRASYPDE